MDQVRTSVDANDASSGAAARIEARNAVQWLVRMTRSFADAGSGDGDIGLRWCRKSRTIVTPEVAPGVTLELAIATLTFQFMEGGKPSPHALDPEGKSSTEIEAWLLVEMLHRGFNREAFSKNLPYDMPHLMTGDEVKYNPESMAADLELLTQRLSDAADVLTEAQRRLRPDAATGVSLLVCWPESLDIGFAHPLWDQTADAETITIRFTLGDDKGVQPGFFIRRETTPPAVSRVADLADDGKADKAASHAAVATSLVEAFKAMRSGAAH